MYSGSTNGEIFAWKMWEKKMISSLKSHTDIGGNRTRCIHTIHTSLMVSE